MWDIGAAFAAGCAYTGEALQGKDYQRCAALNVMVPTADLSGGAMFVGTAPHRAKTKEVASLAVGMARAARCSIFG